MTILPAAVGAGTLIRQNAAGIKPLLRAGLTLAALLCQQKQKWGSRVAGRGQPIALHGLARAKARASAYSAPRRASGLMIGELK
jgi:hypothetical protein